MSVDLNNIKEQIQTIFQAANTTTASPVDLSSGLSERVDDNGIFKTHVQKIMANATVFNFVTTYIEGKDIELQTIGKNQAMGRRMGTVDIKVVGGVWNQNFSTVDEDPADEDIENLMENIEEILRSNSNLNNSVLWASPVNVEYHEKVFPAEQTHLRVGIMSLTARIDY